MNVDRLLALYEQVADAPDAVPRLRRFVLDLAVRGKLVPQEAGDEPASELLKRIAAEKARLVKVGQIKKPKLLEPIEEPPFPIPPGWTWARLGTIAAYIQRGKSPKYAPTNGAPVISQKCVQWTGLDLAAAKRVTLDSLEKYEAIRFLRDGDLLWNSTGTGTIGRIIRLSDPPEKLVCDSHVTVVRCLEADPEYVRTWLRTDHVYGVIEYRAAGSTNQVELTAQMANNQPVPLPPLAEQRRIVAKVEELMALLDRLEAARTARETTRDRLTAASLARLTAPDADTADFAANARFALATLPALTTRSDQIKPLRQTILNLAVRGKLVEQDPTDEPASYELEKVVKLKADHNLRNPKKVATIADEEKWSLTPAGWCWTRWDQITNWITYGFTRPVEHVETGVPIVTGKNVNEGQIIFETASLTPTTLFDALNEKDKPQPGDILITKDGSIGRTAIVEDRHLPFCINQSVAVMWLRSCHFERRYLKLVLDSPQTQDALQQKTAGVAIKHISITDLGKMVFPLPPLAEQHRIVAKVDALMALCDRLEAALITADTARARLLEALLHEALESASSAGRVAAE
ncbi:MAG: restriction endonuclease subunit S [Hyphomicrobiales bacterium]|nr:MAG: restriction endonuclease subunit S [Hyphomicrobiales bacterium]